MGVVVRHRLVSVDDEIGEFEARDVLALDVRNLVFENQRDNARRLEVDIAQIEATVSRLQELRQEKVERRSELN